MAYNIAKYNCNADGSLTIGQYGGGDCKTPVLPANHDASIPFSLPSDGGCYTLGAAETAVAALATNKNKICKIPADFKAGTDAITIGSDVTEHAGCAAAVKTYTETGGALAGLSIGASDTCSALSDIQSTRILDALATACCSENSGAGKSFCIADAVPTCGEYTTEDTTGAFPSSSCTGTRVYDSTKEDATSPSDANCCKAAPLE